MACSIIKTGAARNFAADVKTKPLRFFAKTTGTPTRRHTDFAIAIIPYRQKYCREYFRGNTGRGVPAPAAARFPRPDFIRPKKHPARMFCEKTSLRASAK
jgi:hypothetical protein